MVGKLKKLIKECVYEAIKEIEEDRTREIKAVDPLEEPKEETKEIVFDAATFNEWIYGKDE